VKCIVLVRAPWAKHRLLASDHAGPKQSVLFLGEALGRSTVYCHGCYLIKVVAFLDLRCTNFDFTSAAFYVVLSRCQRLSCVYCQVDVGTIR
jgi:hypothetical protein